MLNKYVADYTFFVSDKYNLIYLPIPKIASTSIKKHITIADKNTRQTKNLEENIFNNYFKFTIIRNPFDRLVSCYHDHILGRLKSGVREQLDMSRGQSFEDFCKALRVFCDKSSPEKLDVHVRPMSQLLTATSNNTLYSGLQFLNLIGKIEFLEHDIKSVFEQQNLPHVSELGKTFTSRDKSKHYKEFYTKEAKLIASEIYTQDLLFFEYEF